MDDTYRTVKLHQILRLPRRPKGFEFSKEMFTLNVSCPCCYCYLSHYRRTMLTIPAETGKLASSSFFHLVQHRSKQLFSAAHFFTLFRFATIKASSSSSSFWIYKTRSASSVASTSATLYIYICAQQSRFRRIVCRLRCRGLGRFSLVHRMAHAVFFTWRSRNSLGMRSNRFEPPNSLWSSRWTSCVDASHFGDCTLWIHMDPQFGSTLWVYILDPHCGSDRLVLSYTLQTSWRAFRTPLVRNRSTHSSGHWLFILLFLPKFVYQKVLSKNYLLK